MVINHIMLDIYVIHVLCTAYPYVRNIDLIVVMLEEEKEGGEMGGGRKIVLSMFLMLG